MENKSFSHYTIVKKLGAGGMASVYLADDNELPRQVALKLLPQQFIADKHLTERFFREARAAASLEHPNIILIYEASVHEGQPFIAMQYIKGPTIQELIAAKGKMDVEEASLIVCKVLETLETAHQKGIFHRDIKPTNIMLKDGKYVRVIDFGIAKAQTDPNLTQAGTAFGTPAYMAPEQFSARPDANNALFDVYAVGVTYYYMLCGKLPFEGDDPYTIRDAKMSKRPANPSTLGSAVPQALDEVIHKSLATDPKDRFQSSREMMMAIKNALSATSVIEIDEGEDIEVTRIITAEERPDKKPGGKLKLPLIIAAAVVLVIAGYFLKDVIFPPGDVELTKPDGGGSKVIPVAIKLKPPFLLSPAGNANISNTKRPEFVWSSAAGVGGNYVLEYSSNQEFSNAIRNKDLTDTTFRPLGDLSNGTYFWRVQADNDTSQASDFATPFSFTIDFPIQQQNGTINLTVNERSSFFIDNKLVKANTTSWQGDFPAGSHKITVENKDSNEGKFEETISLASGKSVTKNYKFTKAATTAEVRVATPGFTSEFYVNDKLIPDVNTAGTLNLKPGNYDIKAKRTDNGDEISRFVSISDKGRYRIIFDFNADSSSFITEN